MLFAPFYEYSYIAEYKAEMAMLNNPEESNPVSFPVIEDWQEREV